MAYADFDGMKKEFPARNFDNVDITEDFNIAGQNGAGVYGAFKFFHGIRSFFKGISALGKLASGSRILVSDDKGNISYTTPSEITKGFATDESVNNALANNIKLKLEKTVNLVRGANVITFNTNKAYILIASGNNYGQGVCIVAQGYNNAVVRNAVISNNITFGDNDYTSNKQMTVTSTGGGEIELKIYRID